VLDALLAGPWAGSVESTVPTAGTLLVTVTDVRAMPGVGQWLTAASTDAARRPPGPTSGPSGASIVIPVRYDGVDLAEVAQRCGMTPADVVAAHTASRFTVEFFGFAPGFAYLTGLDARLQLPRRDSPRTGVPAGAVAIAGPQSVVYPGGTPGGWHLIGTTDRRLWDEDRDPPALLAVGDGVRFESVGDP
jgi:KipI family sensor histidine kinase inhibitor